MRDRYRLLSLAILAAAITLLFATAQLSQADDANPSDSDAPPAQPAPEADDDDAMPDAEVEGEPDAGEGEAAEDAEPEPTEAVINERAPNFTLTDAAGNEHTLSDYEGQYVVLEWINFDCPFVRNHYRRSGHMPELQREFVEQDVVWLSICSSGPRRQGHFTGDTLTDRLEAEDWSGTAYLIDEDGTVGRLYNARTTPHMFVIDPERTLRYMGAIDSIRSTRPRDVSRATNYVEAALTALLEDEDVETQTSTAYG